MRKSKARAKARATSARIRALGVWMGPLLVMAVVVLGIFFFTRSSHDSTTGGQPPTKPAGAQTNHPASSEHWTVANGLPTQVTGMAFSSADTARGYAVAFVNKQTQAIYSTTDSGTNWRQTGIVQGPVGDLLSTDPHDAQDLVMLSVYAPTPGQYTFQRSFDGGRTWSTQATDLPTTGMVSKIGWADATFLVGFQLDGQLLGSSAVVAFPKNHPSAHLDVNGKINGAAIPHLRLLTGRNAKIVVWGDDGTNPIGFATNDAGASWTALSSTILGAQFTPTAATDDGSAVIATTANLKQVALSSDGGDTWVALPTFADTQPIQGAFISAKNKAVVFSRGDGSYAVRNGAWSRITNKQIAFLSDGAATHTARLWAYDDNGHVIWLDA